MKETLQETTQTEFIDESSQQINLGRVTVLEYLAQETNLVSVDMTGRTTMHMNTDMDD